MKKFFSILVITMILGYAYSQETADTLWKFSGVTSVNLSQMALSNWAAGGENSLAGNAMSQSERQLQKQGWQCQLDQ